MFLVYESYAPNWKPSLQIYFSLKFDEIDLNANSMRPNLMALRKKIPTKTLENLGPKAREWNKESLYHFLCKK